MIIITDSREQLPYNFQGYDVQVVRAGLPAGDYSIPGAESLVAIERKELNDLIGCLMGKQRDRFTRELARLRPYHLAAVVVESTLEDVARGRYVSKMSPQAALQSIIAMQVRYGVPFMFCGDRKGAQYVTHAMLQKYQREVCKQYEAMKKCLAAGK